MNIFLNRGQILTVASNEDVFKRGESYYKTGNVLEMTINENEGSDSVMRALVKGNYRDYKTLVIFDAYGRLRNYSCDCQSESIWKGGCKHVVASLFAIIDTKGQTLINAKRLRIAEQLTNEFQKQIYMEIDDDESLNPFRADKMTDIILEPRLNITKTDAFLTFAVGTGKKYIIKNIEEFISSVNKKETVSYGKKLTFRHSIDSFDKESTMLFRFIEKEFISQAKIVDNVLSSLPYYHYSKTGQKCIWLTGNVLDDFFEMYANKVVNGTIENTDGKISFKLLPEHPDLKLSLLSNGDKLALSAPKLNASVIHGDKWSYIIILPNIYRVEDEYAKALLPVLNACYEFENAKMEFEGFMKKKIMTFVIPRLIKHGLLEDVPENIEILAYPLKSRLYFDMDGNSVICKVVFEYGENQINPITDKQDNSIIESTFIRDISGEYKILKKLLSAGFTEDIKNAYYTLSNDDAIYDLYNATMDELKAESEIFATDEFDKKLLKRPLKKTSMGVRITGNLLELSVDTSQYSLTELLEAIDAFKSKKRFHRLKDGRFISFSDEDLNSAIDIISSLDLNKKQVTGNVVKLPKYRALYLDSLSDDVQIFEKNDEFRKMASDFKRYKDVEFKPPEKVGKVMRNYQLIGYSWLKTLAHYGFGGILADDMGLGKTLQILAVLLDDKIGESTNGGKTEHTDGEPSLVVSPTSLIYNWEQEINKFTPELNAVVVNGTPARRTELLNTPDTDVFITTYDMLKRDIENYKLRSFKYIIIDEAQNVKNPETQNAKAVKELKGRTRFALTGTPIENSLSELWSIFDFIMPGYLYNASKFSKLYETPIVKNDDKEQSRLLQKQILPFILRRLKTDVLSELPEKTETTLFALMYPEQMKIYTASLLKAKGELDQFVSDGSFSKSRIKILAELTRLRQICCHPSLFMENYDGGSGKLDLALETLEIAIESGHRALVFSQFTSMLNILKIALDEKKYSYFYLDGHTNAADRNDMVNRFNSGENNIFLISLKAGGTGLNLTGADVVIHYDPWWNPAVMDQASDRAHRLGQKRAVQIYNIVAKGSIEEKILELQSKKKDLIDSVLTKGASFINKMSEEEVKALFV